MEFDALPRGLNQITSRVEESPWEKGLKDKVLKVFKALAEAEALVHGQAIDTVHFHEVGSLDAFIEVVSVCAAIEYLNPIKY